MSFHLPFFLINPIFLINYTDIFPFNYNDRTNDFEKKQKWSIKSKLTIILFFTITRFVLSINIFKSYSEFVLVVKLVSVYYFFALSVAIFAIIYFSYKTENKKLTIINNSYRIYKDENFRNKEYCSLIPLIVFGLSNISILVMHNVSDVMRMYNRSSRKIVLGLIYTSLALWHEYLIITTEIKIVSTYLLLTQFSNYLKQVLDENKNERLIKLQQTLSDLIMCASEQLSLIYLSVINYHFSCAIGYITEISCEFHGEHFSKLNLGMLLLHLGRMFYLFVIPSLCIIRVSNVYRHTRCLVNKWTKFQGKK